NRGARDHSESLSLKAGRRRRLRLPGREGMDRRGVQIGRAPASALKGRTRLLRAEAIAGHPHRRAPCVRGGQSARWQLQPEPYLPLLALERGGVVRAPVGIADCELQIAEN